MSSASSRAKQTDLAHSRCGSVLQISLAKILNIIGLRRLPPQRRDPLQNGTSRCGSVGIVRRSVAKSHAAASVTANCLSLAASKHDCIDDLPGPPRATKRLQIEPAFIQGEGLPLLREAEAGSLRDAALVPSGEDSIASSQALPGDRSRPRLDSRTWRTMFGVNRCSNPKSPFPGQQSRASCNR
jgi:hypothetical protein